MAEAFTLPYFDKFSVACTYYLSAQKIVPINIPSVAYGNPVTVELNFSDTWTYGICQITSMIQGSSKYHSIPISISSNTTNLTIFCYNTTSGIEGAVATDLRLIITSTSAIFGLSSNASTFTNLNGFIYIVN